MPVDESLLARNQLLASLPAAERANFARALSAGEFDFKATVYDQGGSIDSVVFPVHGVFSLISSVPDGRSAEIATIGNEGVVGLPAFLAPALPTVHRAIAQIPGDAMFVPVTRFLKAAGGNAGLHTALHGYAQALMTQIAQGSVCNRLHAVERRCIRWLLQTHDRVGVDQFPLTQEFLGHMLGVGRQTVNLTARRLQDAGLIHYVRGRMTILDRPKLEAEACECYRVVRDQFERLYQRGAEGDRPPTAR